MYQRIRAEGTSWAGPSYESILDANNVTADTFSHTSNSQKDNANAIFTSEKLDKSDELEDALKDLTINNAEYYESR